ncbi:MAG TPA: complement resistance protein TraT [Candidatus Macondimonas sp.]|nr:complement resistance protein TraT [Candidatus Macondimonas sp.]
MGILLLLVLALAGCGRNAKKDDPSGLSVNGVDLEVKMSANVFIPPLAPPVPEARRRIYVVGTNTSTVHSANDRLQPLLLQQLAQRGYVITHNPADAHYMLLYNVLYVGKEVRDLSTVTALATGVGGAAVAATIGRRNEVIQNAGIGGLVGTVTGAVTGHYFETNTYELVVDLQIRERQPAVPPPLPPAEAQRIAVEQAFRQVNAVLGLADSQIESAATTDRHTPASPDSWQLYNSQVVGFASKLRLSFQEAEPLLFQAMAREMSGIFWDLNRQPGSAAPTAAPRT